MAAFCLFYCKLYLFNPVFGLFRRPRITDVSLCRCESRDRNSEGRAGNIGETELVAELNRGRVAAVLTAYTDVHVRAYLATEGYSHLHKLADAVLVDLDERITLEDLRVIVGAEELSGVVT